ncbi:MAG: FtsX-like permease family protein [Spirochaetaceae bacterium]|nr:FtsX-like permease family protein [Spirochaetaceae bacterium]
MGKFIGVAFRNISRNGKRSFTLGVNYAIVTFLLVLLFSFTRGATGTVTSSLARSSAGHITVSGQFATGGRIFIGLRGADRIAAAARESFGPEATVLTRYTLQSTVYYNGLSKRIGFLGIDAAADTGLRGQMAFGQGGWDEWAEDPAGLALPAELADYFGLSLGDEVVVSTRTRFGAFNTGILKVRGIWKTDNFFLRGQAVVPFDFLRSLDLAAPDAATSVFVYFPEARDLAARRDLLASRLESAGFEVSRPKTDQEAIAAVSSASSKYEADPENRDRVMLKLATLDEVLGIVKSVLTAVNAVGALVASILLFVIAVSIFINLRMSVNERLREIGTMRALGFQAGGVTALFVGESVALALAFSAAGAALGSLAAGAVRWLLSFPPGGQLGLFLEGGRLALRPDLRDIALIVIAIALFAALFSWFPARRGGRIRPVDALTRTF